MDGISINNMPASEQFIPCDIHFYSIKDVIQLTGWSEPTVIKLFNDPDFPSCNYGKTKIVEAGGLRNYFSEHREKRYNRYWR